MLKCDATAAISNGNKVVVIKLVRGATGLGLKEAKDLTETQVFPLDINERYMLSHAGRTRKDLIRDLRGAGVIVTDGPMAADTTLSMLEDALHEAVNMQTLEVAEDILGLLKKWRKK